MSNLIFRLVKSGFDVNRKHTLGWTTLQAAAINGKTEVAKVLLELGADPNVADDFFNAHRTAIDKGLRTMDGTISCYIFN